MTSNQPQTLVVWKLQRPIITNGDYNEVMAYTEDRERIAFIGMSEEMIEEIFGDEFKIYVTGKVKKGILVVDEIIEEQAW